MELRQYLVFINFIYFVQFISTLEIIKYYQFTLLSVSQQKSTPYLITYQSNSLFDLFIYFTNYYKSKQQTKKVFLIFNPRQMKMQIERQNDINFKINPQRLQAEFQCTVCLNPINDCYITRCGHVYCKSCIQETINRHHRCPFCNQQLKQFQADVFKNYHFNTIKKIVEQQIRKQNEKYLGKAFSEKISQLEDPEGEDKLMKPIQNRILVMFEDTMLKYRKYMVEMYALGKRTEEKRLLYGAKSIRTHEQIIKQLQTYIITNLPAPLISPELISSPTQLQLILPTRKIHKTSIKLSPMAQISSILPYMQSICSQMNVRIEGQMPSQLLVNGEKMSIDARVGVLAGKSIRIEGIPIQVNVYCYTHNWDGAKVTNFYNCKSCMTKWICENCVLLCHKGHDAMIQLKNHKPDWACCYCVTKCDCKAINKSSKIKM